MPSLELTLLFVSMLLSAGLPRMSVVGNVPLYVDEKRGYDDVRV